MVELKDNVYLAFKCPSCQKALYLPASMGGTTGPCPACRQSIEGPRLIQYPEVEEDLAGGNLAVGRTAVEMNPVTRETSPTGGVSAEAGERGASLGAGPKLETTVVEARVGMEEEGGGGFQARRRIELPDDAQADERWRDRQREMAEESRKRKKRDRFAQKLRSKKVGFLLVFFFCVAMGYLIYRNYVAKAEEAKRLEALEATRLEEAAREDRVVSISGALLH